MSGFGSSPGNVVTTQYVQPTTGQIVAANSGINALLVDPAGTLATLTIVLPASPVEGQIFMVGSSQICTTLTMTGTSTGSPTSLTAGGFARFCYSATSSKWFRIG